MSWFTILTILLTLLVALYITYKCRRKRLRSIIAIAPSDDDIPFPLRSIIRIQFHQTLSRMLPRRRFTFKSLLHYAIPVYIPTQFVHYMFASFIKLFDILNNVVSLRFIVCKEAIKCQFVIGQILSKYNNYNLNNSWQDQFYGNGVKLSFYFICNL